MSIISKDIQKAIALLNNEDVVAIPTETVYGLAGNIYSEKAIKTIFKVKKRPSYNPLIVHISSINKLYTIAKDIPEKARQLASVFWPGPLTLVLKKQSNIPDLITAEKETVAVRVPNHPLALELLSQLNFPLAAPSANPFNRISPTKPEHVEAYFKNDIKMVLDGGTCINGIESTIIGFENEELIIYRLGSTSLESIESVVGKIEIKNQKSKIKNPNAPGMLAKHYAPKTRLILTNNISDEIKNYIGKKMGFLVFSKIDASLLSHYHMFLSKDNNLKEAASNLYSALHQLDSKNLDVIIAERFPDMSLGKSINDRLERASK